MATDQGDSRAVLSVGRWAGPGERCESHPALPASSGRLCWCCRPGHGLRGERPVQTVVTSEGGLEGLGSFPPVHLSLLMESKEPPPSERFWQHLALDSPCHFPVQTGWRSPALEDRGLVDLPRAVWL